MKSKIIESLRQVLRFAQGDVTKVRITEAETDITSFFTPWTLACAVGAENGTIGVQIGFERWCSLSRKNWLPEIQKKTGLSSSRIMGALSAYVCENQHLNYKEVLNRESDKRGEPRHTTIGAGETLTVGASFK